MSLRREFVELANQPGANKSELCRRFGISRVTGDKWLARFREAGQHGLEDRSRRPVHSPKRAAEEVEAAVLALRQEHPAWGGRKLRARLLAKGFADVPSASTITAVLRRHGQLAEHRRQQRDWQRFEHEAPNRLWQMDFKGHFAMEQGRCHPLTILDDHSRYALCLKACLDERRTTVQQALVEVFGLYGLPERMLMDNGSPWGYDDDKPYTKLTVWLMRLGIKVGHGKPYHPQTQGKDERFHRTLVAEVVRWEVFRDVEHCQARFDAWREVYNHERPHESLGMAVPGSRYQPSWRRYPEQLPEIEYGPSDVPRKVDGNGCIHFKGRRWRVGKAFIGLPVALRPAEDGCWNIFFCQQQVSTVDLRRNS